MTSMDASVIENRIKSAPIPLPEGDMTAYELAAWMRGYMVALDSFLKILDDFKEER